MHHFLMGITAPPTTLDAWAAFLPATDPPGGVTVYDIATGLPHPCRLCGRSDRWLDEGEHAPVEGLAVRVIDDVGKGAVYERGDKVET